MEKSLEALQSDLAEIKAKIEKCDQFMEKASPEQKEKLNARRCKYEAQRDRLAVAIDVVSGRAYAIYDIDGKLTVIKPDSEGVAKLIRTAEDYGARATKLTSKIL
jgi:hypothetical protein